MLALWSKNKIIARQRRQFQTFMFFSRIGFPLMIGIISIGFSFLLNLQNFKYMAHGNNKSLFLSISYKCFVIYYLFLLLKDSVAYMHFGKYLLFAQLFVKKIRGTCEVTRTNSLSWAVGARFYRCRLKKRNVPLLNIDNYKRTLIR
jgi:fatty-acid desaturase